MVALTTFGHGHPAIDYLLLLAVADDGIGMIIIAAFYGDPANPVKPMYLLITLGAMLVAYGMRRLGIIAWQAYIFGPGVASWSRKATVWIVLPRPISSARIDPRRFHQFHSSQLTPSSW